MAKILTLDLHITRTKEKELTGNPLPSYFETEAPQPKGLVFEAPHAALDPIRQGDN